MPIHNSYSLAACTNASAKPHVYLQARDLLLSLSSAPGEKTEVSAIARSASQSGNPQQAEQARLACALLVGRYTNSSLLAICYIRIYLLPVSSVSSHTSYTFEVRPHICSITHRTTRSSQWLQTGHPTKPRRQDSQESTPSKKLGMAAYRAPSLLQPHRAQEALQDAHDGRIPPLIGFFCGLSCPPVAKVVAQLGFDVVWIDWEHASTNVETMTQVRHTSPLGNSAKRGLINTDGSRRPIL